jgi:hypothetical protein
MLVTILTFPRLLNSSFLWAFSGDILIAIWWGTQADEAFPDAWQSDTGGHPYFRSKVYLSPRLWYLRVTIIEAQDLVPFDKGRLPEPVCLRFT